MRMSHLIIASVFPISMPACDTRKEEAAAVLAGEAPVILDARHQSVLSRIHEVLAERRPSCVEWDGPGPDGLVDAVDTFQWELGGHLVSYQRDRGADGVVDMAVSFAYMEHRLVAEAWDNDNDGANDYERQHAYDGPRQIGETLSDQNGPLESTAFRYAGDVLVARETFRGSPERLAQRVELEWSDGLLEKESVDLDQDGVPDEVRDFAYVDGRLVSLSSDFDQDGVAEERSELTWSEHGLLQEERAFYRDALVLKITYRYEDDMLVAVDYEHSDIGLPWRATPKTDCAR